MLTDTMMYSFSGLGVFAILGLLNPENPHMLTAVLCAVVPFVFSFVVAFVLYKDEVASASTSTPAPAEQASTAALSGPMEIDCPIPGTILSLTEVPDETFSTGVLGNGIAVEPSEGKVYAPFDGECENLADTLHALGLLSKNGVSLLIHVGLETVGLEGKPFKAHVKTGNPIKKGQLLLEFDMDAIKAAGCPTITSVLVTNEDEVGEVKIANNKIIIGG
ncbi:PTS glucose transporter subunit IIA [uncultured Oscillibacter sp.]|uniref:PTS sugar transporter subunit IIA n=1 Tax=uncultured Oscillibacter sp. TaxID=876091 RepID=UPI00262D9965|nr:PTS glucose transporter subunit IIA [uncultured Oscillibacter sp.]